MSESSPSDETPGAPGEEEAEAPEVTPESTDEPREVQADERAEAPPPTSPTRSRWLRWALGLTLLSLFALVIVRSAWLSDDSYITLRTVDNAVHGLGLRWNVAERVQAYTHPLWMLLILPFYAITGDHYWTTVLLSIALSLIAIGLALWGAAPSTIRMVVLAALLFFSRPFLEFSTSGLENPLSHLLLLLFLIVLWRAREATVRGLFWLSLIACLVLLTRMDLILILAPGLLLWLLRLVRQGQWRGALGAAALAGLPFLGWEVFSLIYYGFPFPNTAYAKLGTGIGFVENVTRGLRYYRASLAVDYVTLPTIGAALGGALASRNAKQLVVALGLALYLLYIVRIGGDFMNGRFFTAPLVVAAFLLVQLEVLEKTWAAIPAVALAALFGSITAEPAFLTGADLRAEAGEQLIDAHGICNERKFYYPMTGLLVALEGRPLPDGNMARQGKRYHRRFRDHTGVVVTGAIGFRGFYGGPKTHIIDHNALADPLLARIPAIAKRDHHPGHFRRRIPAGYKRSVEEGRNLIEDPEIHLLYDSVKLVAEGPLFTRERWAAIWALNTGALRVTDRRQP